MCWRRRVLLRNSFDSPYHLPQPSPSHLPSCPSAFLLSLVTPPSHTPPSPLSPLPSEHEDIEDGPHDVQQLGQPYQVRPHQPLPLPSPYCSHAHHLCVAADLRSGTAAGGAARSAARRPAGPLAALLSCRCPMLPRAASATAAATRIPSALSIGGSSDRRRSNQSPPQPRGGGGGGATLRGLSRLNSPSGLLKCDLRLLTGAGRPATRVPQSQSLQCRYQVLS